MKEKETREVFIGQVLALTSVFKREYVHGHGLGEELKI
jgi:hypothetical protein